MKRIEVIIHPDKVSSVFNRLNKLGYPGVIISEIKGHGSQEDINLQVRGNTYKLDLITKARVEVIVKESEVELIIKAICESAFNGEIGDGKIFIHPVDDALRVRTGKRGEVAV